MRTKYLVLGLTMTWLAGCGLQPNVGPIPANVRTTGALAQEKSKFDETQYKEVSYQRTFHSFRAFVDRFTPGVHFKVTGKLSYYKGWSDLLGDKPSGFGMVIGENDDYANLVLEARWHEDATTTRRWFESLGAKPYNGAPDFSGEIVTVFFTFNQNAPVASQIHLDAVKRNGQISLVTMPTPLNK